uniref:DUF4174 domain-containing protein n=1 Tax=Heterorhabditis bacteriophora TaxID=37862 RepID=A0A1I7XGE4_HETBA
MSDFETQSSYDASLISLIASAPVLSLKDLNCNQWSLQIEEIAKKANSSALVISCADDIQDLSLVSQCFGLYFNEKFITGMYKRVIRFVSGELYVFIVPRGSPFEGKKNMHIPKLLTNYTLA